MEKKTVQATTTVTLKDVYIVEGRNPRSAETMTKASLSELCSQIKGAGGIVVPLIVEPKDEKGYAVINGERRYRALHLLNEQGLKFPVPVYVKDEKDKEEKVLLDAILANEGVPLDAIDMSLAVVALVQKHGMERKQVYTSLGKTSQWLSQRFLLAEASPEMIRAYRKKEITVPEMLEIIAKKKQQPPTTKAKNAQTTDHETETSHEEDISEADAIARKKNDRTAKKEATAKLRQLQGGSGKKNGGASGNGNDTPKLDVLQKHALIHLGKHGIDGFLAHIVKAVDVAANGSVGKAERTTWRNIASDLEEAMNHLSTEE